MRILRRIAPALATAALLSITVSGMASATGSLATAATYSAPSGVSVVSKTIDTEAGSCGSGGGAACSSAAVYGASGFSGTLTFDTAGAVTAWDYICTHTPADASFKTFGGTYTFTAYDGTTSLGSVSYTIVGGNTCTGSTNYAAISAGLTFTVPASKVVNYTVSISGVTAGSIAQAAFAGFNSIRNEAFTTCSHTRSYSVPPPTNFIIPEAPFAVLLPLSAGLLAAFFVIRKPRDGEVAA